MKILLYLLALFHGANGVTMLFAGANWYEMVPGVTETGHFNPHFVKDIGIAFIAAAAGLMLASRRLSAIVPAAIFLGGHAALHVFEMITHGMAANAVLRDTLTIVVPGFAPAVIYIFLRSKTLETVQ